MQARRFSLTRRLVLVGGAVLVAPTPAFAHRSQSVLTTVEWNEGEKLLEVTHRMHGHDAEVGLALADNLPAVDITQTANQARLALYIEKRFSLADAVGPIRLEPLGAEIESEAILVYQTAKRPAAPPELTVANQILCDVFDQQTNLVNVRLAKKTRTLLFTEGDKPKKADGLL